MAPAERRLLDSLASQASTIAADIAELEQHEADIRLQLDTAERSGLNCSGRPTCSIASASDDS